MGSEMCIRDSYEDDDEFDDDYDDEEEDDLDDDYDEDDEDKVYIVFVVYTTIIYHKTVLCSISLFIELIYI